jgi:hypothetical protein
MLNCVDTRVRWVVAATDSGQTSVASAPSIERGRNFKVAAAAEFAAREVRLVSVVPRTMTIDGVVKVVDLSDRQMDTTDGRTK